MSKDPPVIPKCDFIANWISQGGRLPVELNLEVKLSGSQQSPVYFSVDVHPQRGAYTVVFHEPIAKVLSFATQLMKTPLEVQQETKKLLVCQQLNSD